MQLTDLVSYLNDYLQIEGVSDYCPNGLQIEGKPELKHVVCGVSACQALIDAAIAKKADALLVHHGFFFKGEPQVITGFRRSRFKAILVNDISLLAYHLPLDTHWDLGNNRGIAQAMGFENVRSTHAGGVDGLLWQGECQTELSAHQLSEQLAAVLSQAPLHIGAEPEHAIKKVAWCTGAAQDLIVDAKALGVDAFITGEVSERTVHMARELGIHFYAAGHHATETFGVKALAQLLNKTFDIHCEFVDTPNPV